MTAFSFFLPRVYVLCVCVCVCVRKKTEHRWNGSRYIIVNRGGRGGGELKLYTGKRGEMEIGPPEVVKSQMFTLIRNKNLERIRLQDPAKSSLTDMRRNVLFFTLYTYGI